VDPPGVRLVDPGRAGQGPLGQRADGDETADNGVRILVTLADRPGQGLVTIRGRLDRVIVVPSQHTRLELADHLGALADRADILGRHGAHLARARLARVSIGRAILAVDPDGLANATNRVARTDDGSHYSGRRKNYRACSYPRRNSRILASFDAPKSKAVPSGIVRLSAG